MAEWFKDWFDTKYYHILYKHRDDEEASLFMRHLKNELDLPLHSTIIDLACGKGRHAKMLNDIGFNVIGLDLSPQSIAFANKMQNESLHFKVHDMREPLSNIKAKAVFNLFTSFGYFENVADNSKVLRAIKSYLLPGGFLVIDYLNATKVINGLVAHETKLLEGIEFELTRVFDGRFIKKMIHIRDGERNMKFEECVQAFTKDELLNLLTEEGYSVRKIFGDYQLKPFNEKDSDRLIIIAGN